MPGAVTYLKEALRTWKGIKLPEVVFVAACKERRKPESVHVKSAAMPTAGCAYANVKSAKDNSRLCLCPARRRGSSRPAKALIISISHTVIDA
ncbi:MAG: hypothetical protein KME52_27280 [Desmonostoc geniculatum HA4340-LM1]|nr:hypothetical protein [Desmonostoc geniculatum HA4340-LM1]